MQHENRLADTKHKARETARQQQDSLVLRTHPAHSLVPIPQKQIFSDMSYDFIRREGLDLIDNNTFDSA